MVETANHRVIILGAGQSPRGTLPSAMINVDENQRLLDWLLSAFEALGSPEVFFVGGYKASMVETEYPEIRFFFNQDWIDTGPARSLALVPLSSTKSNFISYSDVVFRPDAVERIDNNNAECVLAIDSRWRTRFDQRSQADIASAEKVLFDGDTVIDIGRHIHAPSASAEFAGLMKLSGKAAAKLDTILHDGKLDPTAGLPTLLRSLMAQGVRPRFVDIRGDWAELNAPQDLAKFVLGTKAESLARLKPLIHTGNVDDLVAFCHSDWRDDRQKIILRVQKVFGKRSVIVRSSALSEDCWDSTSAGAYLSLPNIDVANAKHLGKAVDRVFESYGEPLDDNQILVQEMLTGVSMSGVIMTRTNLGAPYYVINFDDSTSRTDTVTSGDGDTLRSVFLHHSAELRPELPDQLRKLMTMVKEIETLVGHDSLDIEFAFTNDGRGHVLQVRPIALAHRAQDVDDDKIAHGLERAALYFRDLARPVPFIVGKTTQFNVMTDWNPAEMIGTKPGRLAFSLYRFLITDEPWARQRAEYGYRDVRPCNLITDFLGHPYIDVRVDFNSFVPASLPDRLAEKLVDHYLDRLAQSSTLHDKVEFDVVYTCASFDFSRETERLQQAGITEPEIDLLEQSLVDITRKGIARCAGDLEDLDCFERRFETIMARGIEPLERAYILFEDVRRLGIVIFSHLARHAFVAVYLLKSLNCKGVITNEERESFLDSIRTIPSIMKNDARKVSESTMTWQEFVGKYGHLRPGSYDITSPCYASAPEDFLRPMLDSFAKDNDIHSAEPWSESTRREVAKEIKQLGLGINLDDFLRFLKQAIEGREFGKFVFMRGVNAGLESLAQFGALHGISRDDLAHIRIGDLLSLRGASAENLRKSLVNLARAGQGAFSVTQALCLPGHLFSTHDFYCFEQIGADPNFVSQKKVQAPTILLSGGATPESDLTGRIVLVPNADPGFDWLFSRKIAGLITMYGGVNSHMTIRAAELQLPAAIGVGERLFEKLSQAAMLDLDCASRQIKVIH